MAAESAVVTLTCPQCGGQVHDIQTTDQDRTIPCSYCGKELHIPKIGGDVVHERVVVVERDGTPEPAVAPDYVPPTDVEPSSVITGPRLVVLAVVVAVFVGLLLAIRTQAQNDRDERNRRDEARAHCKAECAESCKRNPEQYGAQLTQEASSSDPAIHDVIEGANRQLRDATVMECGMGCERERCAHL